MKAKDVNTIIVILLIIYFLKITVILIKYNNSSKIILFLRINIGFSMHHTIPHSIYQNIVILSSSISNNFSNSNSN